MPKDKVKEKNTSSVVNVPSANWKKFIANKPKSTALRNKAVQSMKAEMDTIKEFQNTHHKFYFQSGINIYGLDCEMVGVASSRRDMLARVSLVNASGICVLDKFVLPTEDVTDYRTWVSGIRPKDLEKGEHFDSVREEVATIIKNSIVVGHAVGHDFRALRIRHPKCLIRDTSSFPLFREMFSNHTPSLRNLARVVLGVNIQSGEHSSVQDALATVQLYLSYRREWEEYILKGRYRSHK